MLWRQADIRYKILFPITINLTPSIQHQDGKSWRQAGLSRFFTFVFGVWAVLFSFASWM